ncbi:hypothetical protein Back11_39360 [Paenibacillus baekrokdamisoli]|uniref:Transposase n=2 Tax=Paenibacillus baekrokdamisoli TaxID=1712516 RepID=A0A3G9J9T1_9BACL|nr:hypothetical protein Back11_39360 [Paenibacillus baekrokdamisoli]
MGQLEVNAHVLHVSEKSISYSPAFKLAALKAYQQGKTPQEIFIDAGFQLDVIGSRKPNECLKRWRSAHALHGEDGLLEERRGKGATGRKPKEDLSLEEELKRAKAQIKLLEMENDFLKKLEERERQVRASKH